MLSCCLSAMMSAYDTSKPASGLRGDELQVCSSPPNYNHGADEAPRSRLPLKTCKKRRPVGSASWHGTRASAPLKAMLRAIVRVCSHPGGMHEEDVCSHSHPP